MRPEYLVFAVVLIVALVVDLGVLSKKNTTVSMSKALWQTIFWVVLALGFFVYLWIDMRHTPQPHKIPLEYLSAYLMEWSLSIDNIFVFILIFSFFKIEEKYYARVLLIGILMAIVLRILFITVGIGLIHRFEWLLYVFGVILVYTGIQMFMAKEGENANLANNKIYKFLIRFIPVTSEEHSGKFTIKKDGKRYFTYMTLVVLMLAGTDIVFALDSIPAVFAISQDSLVIYTSNIFAVLGLRSLFFLLKGAINKFTYLPQGIAVVLVFIGLKMLLEYFFSIPIYISLLVIVVCIVGSILYSVNRAEEEEEVEIESK